MRRFGSSSSGLLLSEGKDIHVNLRGVTEPPNPPQRTEVGYIVLSFYDINTFLLDSLKE